MRKNTKIAINKFFKQQINIEFVKEDVRYNFDIIFNYTSIPNYNKIIKVAFDYQFNYVDLQEPLVFEGERDSSIYLKCIDIMRRNYYLTNLLLNVTKLPKN